LGAVKNIKHFIGHSSSKILGAKKGMKRRERR